MNKTNEIQKNKLTHTPNKHEITMGYLALVYALILFFTLSNSFFNTLLHKDDKWTFFYMFTYQSNILVWLWLLGFGIAAFWVNAPFKKFIHNKTTIIAITVYISVTFFIVACVLEPFYDGKFRPTSSLFHHFFSAIVMWLYFFFVPGVGDTRYRTAFFILIYPIIFFIINLIIGGTVNYANGKPAYAYVFIDPSNYPNIFVFIAVILVLIGIFACFGLLLIKLKRYLLKITADTKNS